jgi:hypothetical protein
MKLLCQSFLHFKAFSNVFPELPSRKCFNLHSKAAVVCLYLFPWTQNADYFLFNSLIAKYNKETYKNKLCCLSLWYIWDVKEINWDIYNCWGKVGWFEWIG